MFSSLKVKLLLIHVDGVKDEEMTHPSTTTTNTKFVSHRRPTCHSKQKTRIRGSHTSMASFVADAFALLEAGGVQDGVLDDESMMLSFELGERSFSVVGADYPGSTLVFAEGGDKSFKGLSLELIVAELSLNRAVSDTQPQDDEPEPMVAVPAAVPLWLQHVKAAKVRVFSFLPPLACSHSSRL